MALLVAAQANASIEYPGDLCCALYSENFYEGDAYKVCYDNYRQGGPQTYGLDPPVRANSFWCGKHVSYDFWDSSNHNEHRSGAGALRSAETQAEHPVGILTLNYFDKATRGAVTAFGGSECKEPAGRFDAHDDKTKKKEYNMDDLHTAGLWDNMIDSIAVPWGYAVELYSDDGFTGDRLVVTGMDNHGDPEEMECVNIRKQDFGDRVSSLTVYHASHGRKARGRWFPVKSNTEGIKFKYHVGMSKTSEHDESSNSTMSYAMEVSMEEGIEFESATESMSASASLELVTDTKDAMTHNYAVDQWETCKGAVGNKGGTALWQFLMDSGAGNVFAAAAHTICRYGANMGTPPACVWNRCGGGECTECLDD